MKKNCWEILRCDKKECPVISEERLNGIHDGLNGGRACWVLALATLSAVCLLAAGLVGFAGSASAVELPVQRVSQDDSVTPFATIQAAYTDDATASTDDIQCLAELFRESLLFDKALDINLSGGYDFISNDIVGMSTIYRFTIAGGSVNISDLMIVSCIPMSCADWGIECGYAPDGCGYLIACGACPAGICGGGGIGICGSGSCVPKTCADQGIQCGPASDGCDGMIDCGSCPVGQACGGGGLSICG